MSLVGKTILITGGDMAQTNQRAVQLGSAGVVYMGAGVDSHNRDQPAQTNLAVYERNGADVTSAVVRGP